VKLAEVKAEYDTPILPDGVTRRFDRFFARMRITIDGMQCFCYGSALLGRLKYGLRVGVGYFVSQPRRECMPISKSSLAVVASVAVLFPAVANAQIIKVTQSMSKAGVQSDIGKTEIIVTGKGTTKYDKVVTKKIDVWLTISAPGKPPRDKKKTSGSASVEGEGDLFVSGGFSGSAKIYKLSFKYKGPRSQSVENTRVSPIKLCNDRLKSLSGNARKDFLRKGGNISFKNAYVARATQSWTVRKKNSVFKESKSWNDTAAIRVIIKCRKLEGPKPRTKTSTRKGGGKPKASKMKPTIVKATLRASPMKVKAIGGQRCPTQLRLTGFLETRRAFKGDIIFFGPGFLTPKKPVNMSGASTRNVFAVRDLKWAVGGAKNLSAGASQGPRSQNVTLRMNVVNKENKVRKSVTKNVKITCEIVAKPSDLKM